MSASRRRMIGKRSLSPGRPKNASLDGRILQATLRLLADTGYEGLSIEEVARRAGTAKTSIYRRWPTKDALTLAAVRHFLRHHDSGAVTGDDDTGSLRADLLARASRLATLLTPERIGVFAGLLLAIRTNPALAELVRAELVQREVSAIEPILKRAVARGDIANAVRPVLLPHVLPSLIFTRVLVLDRPADPAFVRHAIDELLLPLLDVRSGGTITPGTRSTRIRS